MTSIQCKTDIPVIEGLTDGELTVGREFLLICTGDFPREFQPEKAQLVLKPEEKYSLHLFGFEFRSPTEADLKVTSYRAGQFQFQDLQVTDGAQTLSLGALQYQVASKIPAAKPGEEQVKQEPYPAIGPASIDVPPLYWALLAGAIGLVVLIVISKIYRVVQRRNMLERLREHDSAMTPLAQFHQSFRRLQRKNPVFFGQEGTAQDFSEVLKETSQMLKLFLTRQYQIPAFEWNDRLILKDLQKYHRNIFEEAGYELRLLFHEYSEAFKDESKLKSVDALNIANQCRGLVEKMERLK